VKKVRGESEQTSFFFFFFFLFPSPWAGSKALDARSLCLLGPGLLIRLCLAVVDHLSWSGIFEPRLAKFYIRTKGFSASIVAKSIRENTKLFSIAANQSKRILLPSMLKELSENFGFIQVPELINFPSHSVSAGATSVERSTGFTFGAGEVEDIGRVGDNTRCSGKSAPEGFR
jgi:hypothetical protein